MAAGTHTPPLCCWIKRETRALCVLWMTMFVTTRVSRKPRVKDKWTLACGAAQTRDDPLLLSVASPRGCKNRTRRDQWPATKQRWLLPSSLHWCCPFTALHLRDGGSNGIFLLLLFPLITLSIQLCRPSKPRDSLLHYKFASKLITSSCLINLVPLDRLEFSVKPKSLDCESDRLLHTENTWTMNPDPVTYTCERLERQPAVCCLYFGRCTDKSCRILDAVRLATGGRIPSTVQLVVEVAGLRQCWKSGTGMRRAAAAGEEEEEGKYETAPISRSYYSRVFLDHVEFNLIASQFWRRLSVLGIDEREWKEKCWLLLERISEGI